MDEIATPETPIEVPVDEQLVETIQKLMAQEAEQAAGVEISEKKRQLSQHVISQYEASKRWRMSSHEEVWNRLTRNYLGIYDPDMAARKESWQVKMFIPITNQVVEVIKSALYRILFLSAEEKNVTARPGGDTIQADMKDKLIRYYKDVSRFASKSNDVMHQCLVYGSGFAKIYWDTKTEIRSVRVPILSNPIMDKILFRAPTIEKYQTQFEEVPVFDGVRYDPVDIFDIFPEPSSEKIDEDHYFIQRGKMRYGDIVALAQKGLIFPEAVSELRDYSESKIEVDKQETKEANGDTSFQNTPHTLYEKQFTVLEDYCLVPRKWVFLNDPEIESPEALVHAKVLVAINGTVLAVEENTDRTPPFAKMDYIPIPGRFYGVGPAELVASINEEINEIRNLRVDNVNLIINRMFAVIENKLISAKDLVSRPGGFIRLKSVEDIRNAIIPLDFPDVTRSSYQESFELEKQAQEVSGANKVTLGSGGAAAKDINQTLGGMELIASMAGNRFAYIASLIESRFKSDTTRRFYKAIYRYIQPQTVDRLLGPGASIIFQMQDPESMEREYDLTTSGLLAAQDKDKQIQIILALKQAYQGNPGFDEFEALRRVTAMSNIENPEKFIRPIPGITVPLMPGQSMPMPMQGEEGNGSAPSGSGGAPSGAQGQ